MSNQPNPDSPLQKKIREQLKQHPGTPATGQPSPQEPSEEPPGDRDEPTA